MIIHAGGDLMILQAAQLESIISSMQSPLDSVERRQSERGPLSATVQICRRAGDEPSEWFTAVPRDVSETGIGLVTSRALDSGEHVAVRLASSQQTLTLECTVMHSSSVGDNLFISGLRFVEVLQTEQP